LRDVRNSMTTSCDGGAMESTTVLDVGMEALDLLTVGEVAARMRVSTVTVRRLIASDDLEAVRIGRLVRVAPEALADYKGRLRAAVGPLSG
jgi:excisionase family DNA binding protein